MDAKRAIKVLREVKENFILKGLELESFDTALSALEKQMPKKPETTSNEHGDTESCSWCGASICWAGDYDLSDGVYPEYCRMCGQKLDWD